MSRYIKRVLGPDEQVVYAAQIHWYVYLYGLSFVLLGAVLGHLVSYAVSYVFGVHDVQLVTKISRIASLALIGLGALLMLGAFIKQVSTELVITNRRVIAKHGLIATTTFELMMTKVEGANIDQTILGRLLGFGTILVKGTGGGISPIDHIAAPYRFHNYLMGVLQNIQQPREQETDLHD